MPQCYLVALEEEYIYTLYFKGFSPTSHRTYPIENWHDFLTKLMAFVP